METCTSWDGDKTIRLVTSFSFSGVIVCQCVYVADNALKKAILFTIKRSLHDHIRLLWREDVVLQLSHVLGG